MSATMDMASSVQLMAIGVFFGRFLMAETPKDDNNKPT
jgi:hypothetical protein